VLTPPAAPAKEKLDLAARFVRLPLAARANVRSTASRLCHGILQIVALFGSAVGNGNLLLLTQRVVSNRPVPAGIARTRR